MSSLRSCEIDGEDPERKIFASSGRVLHTLPKGILSVAEPRVKFECRNDGSTVFIQTWGDARKLTVDLGPDGLQMSGNVTLIVNGEQQYQGTVPEKPISVAFTNPPIY